MPTVTTIALGHWLDTAAAASYLRMRAAGCPAGITDAGRTHAEQIALFLSRYTTSYLRSSRRDRRSWQGRTYWRLKGVASAATPGESNHETGTALDLPDAPEAWVRANGAPYGWIADRVAGEGWHVEYIASRDQHVPAPEPVAPALVPNLTATTAQEDDMIALIQLMFHRYFGVAPTDRMVLDQSDALSGMTPAQAHKAFRGAIATADSVRACYSELLGRDPKPSDIAERAGIQTLEKMWTDIATSPEARARR